MLEAHTTGKSTVGVYTYDIAKTKVMQVETLAEQYEHPLKCILEVEEGGEEE
jgi:ATP-dependent Clp protease adaptor protein ClpS